MHYKNNLSYKRSSIHNSNVCFVSKTHTTVTLVQENMEVKHYDSTRHHSLKQVSDLEIRKVNADSSSIYSPSFFF
jgi:hypothetical protein